MKHSIWVLALVACLSLPAVGMTFLPSRIDISELPFVEISFMLRDQQGFANAVGMHELVVKVDAKQAVITDFNKQVARRDRRYVLFMFDESAAMKGEATAVAKQLAQQVTAGLAQQDYAAYVGFHAQGARIVDFTTDKQQVLNAVWQVTPSRTLPRDAEGDLIRRMAIFKQRVIDQNKQGGIFVFFHLDNLPFDMGYELAQEFDFIHLFLFGAKETSIGQITSNRLYINPHLDTSLSDIIETLLQHRRCAYTMRVNLPLDFDGNTHRLYIGLRSGPLYTRSFIAQHKHERANQALRITPFYMHRFLMYLSLLTGVNIFLFLVVRLYKTFYYKMGIRLLYKRFFISQVIIVLLALLMSVLY